MGSVSPRALGCGGRRCTRSARIRQLEGLGPKQLILSVDNNTEFSHDVSKCVFVYFGVISQKKNDGSKYHKITEIQKNS